MPLESRLALRLPEGAPVELRIAGAASRAVAAAVDVVLAMVTIVAPLALVADATSDGWAVNGVGEWWLATSPAVGAVVAVVLWPLAWEVGTGGRTPGKRLVGLRIVAADGGLLTVRALLVRNVLRVVDVLPLPYGSGLVVSVLSRRGQRIGDLAAGTVVVRDVALHRAALAPPAATALGWAARHAPGAVLDPRVWDTAGLTDADLRLVRRFLERRANLPPPVRLWAADRLAQRIWPKLVGAPPGLPAEALLEGAVLGRMR